MKHKFKNDRYQKTRGGNSQFLNLFCSSCRSHLLLYQKDGRGTLIRLYLDRIFEPSDLQLLQERKFKDEVPNLHCPKCNALIATPMVYEPENRLALRLIRGRSSKQKSDGTYPPSE